MDLATARSNSCQLGLFLEGVLEDSRQPLLPFRNPLGVVAAENLLGVTDQFRRVRDRNATLEQDADERVPEAVWRGSVLESSRLSEDVAQTLAPDFGHRADGRRRAQVRTEHERAKTLLACAQALHKPVGNVRIKLSAGLVHPERDVVALQLFCDVECR